MNSIFDIIGPVMIGPSSSHTAGAARLGKMARCIFRSTPKKVDLTLYVLLRRPIKVMVQIVL